MIKFGSKEHRAQIKRRQKALKDELIREHRINKQNPKLEVFDGENQCKK